MTAPVGGADWQALAPEWSALADRVAAPIGAFVRPQFLAAWWQVFGQPFTLDLHAVRASDRSLIGVLPLMRRADTLSFIGNSDVCDYMDLVAEPSREREVVAALADHLAASSYRVADLRGLAECSPTLAYLPALAKARGWSVQREQEAVCPVVDLPADWPHYLDGLQRKHRHEVRRKLRNLLDGGASIDLEIADDPAQIGDNLRDLLQMLTASRGDKAAFLTDAMADFFCALARNLVSQRWATFCFLRVDGKRVAAVLAFDHQDTLLLYNSGYDPAYRDRAVGMACKVLCVRDAIEKGKRTVNFLRGDESYKMQLGGIPTPVTRLLLTR